MAVDVSGPRLEEAYWHYPMVVARFMSEVWPLRSYCCAVAFEVVHDYYAAEEVVQEAFIKAWLDLARYALQRDGRHLPVKDMRAWLATIVVRTAIDYVRHERKQAMLGLDRGEFLELLGLRSDRPDMIFEDGEGADELSALLRKLPERYRSVLEMRYLQELSYEQIAEKMSCEIELARVVVHRATKSFAQVVKEAGISEMALGRWVKTWITSANEHEVDALAERRQERKQHQEVT